MINVQHDYYFKVLIHENLNNGVNIELQSACMKTHVRIMHQSKTLQLYG
jgi:hypothetical protein